MSALRRLFKKTVLELLPDRLKEAVIHENNIKEFGADLGFHRISYSQQGEDILISKYFENKRNGFYVDIGAYHPVTFSNTFLLHQKGWRGINIDPNQESIQLFEKARKKDINIQCAVANGRKELVYHVFNLGAVNTLNANQAAHWTSVDGFEVVAQRRVVTRPLKEILEEYLPDNTSIDFMNVDVEGYDLEVLQSNDWSLFRPALVMVELLLLQPSDFSSSEVLQFMQQMSYEVYSICNGSVAFIDNMSKKSNQSNR
jgi:FkbM family methyltransferase